MKQSRNMNKVHKRDIKHAICGVTRGGNTGKIVPLSFQDKDVTCGLCKRIMAKGDRKC